MDIQRVAIVFDTTLRPETAGVYCQKALERFVEVQHFQPHELERMPRTGFDLYLNIDDGLRYLLPADCRPSAFWAIDTHLDFGRCREKAPRFDLVFAAQRDGVDLLRGIGVHRLHGCRWLVILVFIASTTMWPSSTTLRSSGMSFRGRGPNCWESFSGDIGIRLLGSDTLRRWHVPMRFEEDFMWPDVIGRYWRPLLPRRVSAR